MPSPFPGMDPYLELHWGDVHSRLITYFVESLNDSLPTDLVAASEERIVVEVDEEGLRRKFKPDVRVVEADLPSSSDELPTRSATATLAPYSFLEESADDPETEHSVRIIEADGERQITS